MAEASLMLHNQNYRLWRVVAQCLVGSVAIALLTFVCFRLRLNLATTAFLYLIIIVLVSLQGSFLLSAVFSLIAAGCLSYYFAPPIFSFRDADPLDSVAIAAFFVTSAVITHLVSRVRKLMQEKLQQSEAYLSQAQRLSHTGSFGWQVSTGEILWSDETFRIFEYDRTTKPTLELILQRVHPGDAPLVKRTIERALQDGKDFEHEYRLMMPDSTVKNVHVVAHASSDESAGIKFVGAVMDISAEERAGEALRRARGDLARASRVTTVGEVTASLAHEVNEPITAAVANANTCLRLLRRDPPDVEEARTAASRIVKDATRAAEIISRIRLLFKKGSPQRELVDVNEVIREMIVLLWTEATQYNILVRTELAADPAWVIGDRLQLQQLLMNLMMNAIDATKDMDGARELIIKSQRAANEQLMVSVSDTGVGLPPQQADQIFNAFFTTKPHGAGMGLSISRSIVESHGGRLWAAENDNSPRGASFCFTLPSKAEAQE
jgi:C4-dicarboxylate-specific signal transduction histidine kinase